MTTRREFLTFMGTAAALAAVARVVDLPVRQSPAPRHVPHVQRFLVGAATNGDIHVVQGTLPAGMVLLGYFEVTRSAWQDRPMRIVGPTGRATHTHFQLLHSFHPAPDAEVTWSEA